MVHHTRVLINLRAYEQNLRKIVSRLAPGCQLCAVLKADAYGHGLELLAPVAAAAGVDAIAIVDNWEAETIRRLGISCAVIRLRPALEEEAEEAAPWGVEEIVGSLEDASALSRLAEKRKAVIPIHIALDEGIGRMGFTVSRQEEQIVKICSMTGLRVRGVMTHFPCADEPELTVTREQRRRFLVECEQIREALPGGVIYHIANSAAILRAPEAHLNMVRLGIVSYGLPPSPHVSLEEGIAPVMSVVTRIVQVRDVPQGATIGYGVTHRVAQDSRIATLPIGYANGYLRDFSNKAQVVIHGQRRPVVGRVSMDMVTVDVGNLDGVQAGDEAVLLGSQGNETITADELANYAGTINYEIACLFGNVNRSDRRADGE